MSAQGSYGNNIDGIPLPGDLTQVESSAAPNRDDDALLSNPEGEREREISINLTKFDSSGEAAEEDESSVENKDANRWSEGLEDEENDFGYISFSEADEDGDEGLLPETQPLSLDALSPGRDVETPPSEGFSDVVLEPDNIQYGSE